MHCCILHISPSPPPPSLPPSIHPPTQARANNLHPESAKSRVRRRQQSKPQNSSTPAPRKPRSNRRDETRRDSKRDETRLRYDIGRPSTVQFGPGQTDRPINPPSLSDTPTKPPLHADANTALTHPPSHQWLPPKPLLKPLLHPQPQPHSPPRSPPPTHQQQPLPPHPSAPSSSPSSSPAPSSSSCPPGN